MTVKQAKTILEVALSLLRDEEIAAEINLQDTKESRDKRTIVIRRSERDLAKIKTATNHIRAALGQLVANPKVARK